MPANVYQLIIPSDACRTLGHRIETRNKATGPGKYEYCYVCSVGYEMAMQQLNNPEEADRFVQSLRRL